jgi:hypothetical protein
MRRFHVTMWMSNVLVIPLLSLLTVCLSSVSALVPVCVGRIFFVAYRQLKFLPG